MNIPDEAVKAAYAAAGAHELTLDDMEAALDAAAPFIRARAMHDLADMDRVFDWDDLRAEALHATPDWNPYEEQS